MNTELTALIAPLRRFAFSLTANKHDADDLLQATLERLLSKPCPDDIELIKWAFRVCRNLWFDEYRARKLRQHSSLSPENSEQYAVDGEHQVVQQIQLQEVGQALNRLPDEQRDILCLVALQGMSYQDVADTLTIPIGTVMSRLSRARVALTTHLQAARSS